MREIKFRIVYQSPDTDVPNKIFISEPFMLDDIHQDQQVDFTDGSYLMREEMDGNDDKIIFEQFIGLKDKNGAEIYEGDILDANPDEYPNDDPCPYIVVYNDGCYKGKRINGKLENALPISKSRLKILNDVIIGNIHEPNN